MRRGMMVAFLHSCGMDALSKLALNNCRRMLSAVEPSAFMKEGGCHLGLVLLWLAFALWLF